MNLHRPRNGEFHTAIYYRKNNGEVFDDNGNQLEYELNGVNFTFKAPDDEQYRIRKQQYSQGYLTDNAGFSIYTTENIDFQPDDKVYLVNEDREFKIEEIRIMYNSSLSIVNSFFTNTNRNKGKWLKLGSLD